jgi:hypothetical protein
MVIGGGTACITCLLSFLQPQPSGEENAPASARVAQNRSISRNPISMRLLGLEHETHHRSDRDVHRPDGKPFRLGMAINPSLSFWNFSMGT